MDDLKLVVAGNLIKLRTEAGLTQAELGAKLNYSDKTISKWERAEALPDAGVLKNLAEIYGTTVDYLLNSHENWAPQAAAEEQSEYSHAMVMLVSVIGIWTLAILLFVIFWVLGSHFWIIFAAAVPTSLITLLILNSIFNSGRYNGVIIATLVLSLIALIYFSLLKYNPWQLFLVAVPAELMVFLCFRIKRRAQKSKA